MKCIKNQKTNEIIRVDDRTAYNMVGNTWQYVQKSEWKAVTRIAKSEKQVEETQKKSETLSEKALKRNRIKQKQRV